MLTCGILHVYVFGAFFTWRWLTLICAVPSIVYFLAMITRSETPHFLISQDKYDEAKKTLVKLRGFIIFSSFLYCVF